jgi:hypothetical protein
MSNQLPAHPKARTAKAIQWLGVLILVQACWIAALALLG